MIGYITTPEQAQAIITAIREAFTSRNLPPFWSTGSYPIYSGPDTGKVFIPASDDIINTPLFAKPLQRPVDFPEFETIVSSLGGLEARITIDPSIIINPQSESEHTP